MSEPTAYCLACGAEVDNFQRIVGASGTYGYRCEGEDGCGREFRLRLLNEVDLMNREAGGQH